MAKDARGTKRVCPACGARFYDLERTPIVCPACQTEYQAPPSRRGGERAAAAAVAVAEPAPKAPVRERREALVTEDAEDTEAVAEDEDIDLGDDDAEIPEGDDDTVFLEEAEEDGETDVTGIVGPGKNEE
jgi:uncharacterized protein (TIGR02300 family)